MLSVRVRVCQCHVIMTDMLGSQHSVHVTAQTLYEACALALRAFREQRFIADEGPIEFEVHVRPCATVHRVQARSV